MSNICITQEQYQASPSNYQIVSGPHDLSCPNNCEPCWICENQGANGSCSSYYPTFSSFNTTCESFGADVFSSESGCLKYCTLCQPKPVTVSVPCSNLSITTTPVSIGWAGQGWLPEFGPRFVSSGPFTPGYPDDTRLRWMIGWPNATYASIPTYDFDLCKYNNVNFTAELQVWSQPRSFDGYEVILDIFYREYWEIPGTSTGYGTPYSLFKYENSGSLSKSYLWNGCNIIVTV